MDRALFNDLYNIVLNVWPPSINTTFKHVSNHGGARIPELIRIHDSLEDSFNRLKDEYGEDINQVEWALYTVIHCVAKEVDEVHLCDIDADEVFKVVINNLSYT